MTLSSGKNSRIKPTENLKIVLFNEVNGLCPKCNKPLMHNNKNQLTKLYEIAHIYPHSAHPHEAELLKNEEKLNDDLDHEDNLIALCRDCHKIFDIPRTIEGYREMIKIKRELQRISRLKNHWYENKLESEINDVINSLVNLTTIATAELSLKAMKVDEKASEELNIMIKMKIKSCVQYFYTHIQNRFAELDKVKPYTSDTIFSQVKTYYLQLKSNGADQNQIFTALSDWIYSVANVKNNEVAEIFVSFFIQNCEVYS
ncbi:ABC-three component system protein [Acinetobacter haemolyticus]|uniref:HNH endonuclease n=3 Tax=Acinetobacter TaxID=469 RepID=A0A6L9E1L8_ACIHA|nr:ABC-three component system protein [Acinetobacter haemolyticus]NAR49991.1 HNH endonuclease [Acinetobacter haemolyticus]NAR59743.1 HNH endonuclease [Acinetobacter haemolyticus]NAR92235.1 HNH endonuclease [Acinetobacter haemolyticus]QHI11583.1 HNH endonuclease [Acinetobacter haemolyticus]QHI14850.1 HNH endonuclease [Acinetobacter haemolyticus]